MSVIAEAKNEKFMAFEGLSDEGDAGDAEDEQGLGTELRSEAVDVGTGNPS